MSVDILMSTYNGSAHIRNQILSLQQQTYEGWKLLVRDDGSTDGTIEIIRKIAEHDARIIFLEEASKENLGPGKSFLYLTKFSTAKYVIFCDQDDLWFEKKLETLVEYAKGYFDPEIPSIVYCDGYGYSDLDGVITLQSISKAHASDLRGFLFFNAGYQGCSMLFNRKLCSLAANYRASYFYMHDDVLSLLAHSFGSVKFIPKRLMLYRQHLQNVTGNIPTGFKSFICRVFDKSRPVISRAHYDEKRAFFDAYRQELSPINQQIFAAYILFPNLPRLKRLMLIIRHKFSYGGSVFSLLVKTAIRKPLV